MSSRKRKYSAYMLAGAVLAVGIFVSAQSASATHIRAKSATPFNVPLVVAYNECTGGAITSTHNPAFLAGSSCTTTGGGTLAGKTSSFITSGDPLSTQAPSGTGAPAQFQGRLVQVVSAAAPHPPNCQPADPATCRTVLFNPGVPNGTFTNTVSGNQSYLADVRCGPAYPAAHPACSAAGSANTSGNSDYTGFLSANSSLRITDHNNDTNPATGSYTEAGTVNQLLFTVPVSCAVTPATIGSFCKAATTDAQALCGCIRQNAGGFANIEEGQVVVTDGNINANPFDTSDGPNADAYRQGVFLP